MSSGSGEPPSPRLRFVDDNEHNALLVALVANPYAAESIMTWKEDALGTEKDAVDEAKTVASAALEAGQGAPPPTHVGTRLSHLSLHSNP
jgi:hypothetical protein